MNFYIFFLIFIIFIALYFFLKTFNLLQENTNYSNHKNIGKQNKKPIVLGGIFFLIVLLLFTQDVSISYKSIIVLITFLGILSDKNLLPNPKIRFIIQIMLLLYIVNDEALKIDDMRYELLNSFLTNNLFNLFFTVFCLAILINGSNFIDGLNGLFSGYYLIVLISIFYLNFLDNNIFLINQNFLEIIFFSLLLFFIFNLFGYIYLGDSGSYLLSFIIGVYLIEFYSNNIDNCSPFYVASLLWYPAFENLFSLLRRTFKKEKLSVPDNLHLHQLIFLFIRDKNIFRKKITNTLTGVSIVMFNIPSLIASSFFARETTFLVMIIMFNICTYIFCYYFFSQKILDKKTT